MSTENQNGQMVITEPQANNTPTVVKTEDVSIGMPTSTFGSKSSFEHSQRVAIMLSQSELIPATFQKKPANVMIALELASRVGASPFMVMQNLYVVHGKPAWSSQFLIATLNASGRFTSLRYEEDDKNGGRTRAIAKDIKSGEMCYGAWVSMEMAKAEGWVEKNGSKWKTMPEVMRRYRAASFFTKQFAPEVSMGIHTYDEAQDIGAVANLANVNTDTGEVVKQDTEQETPVNDPKRDRIEKLILNAKTVADVAKHKISAEEFNLQQVYADKLEELTKAKGE